MEKVSLTENWYEVKFKMIYDANEGLFDSENFLKYFNKSLKQLKRKFDDNNEPFTYYIE